MITEENINLLNAAISAWQQAPSEPDRAAAMRQIKALLGTLPEEEAAAVHEMKALVGILKNLSTVI